MEFRYLVDWRLCYVKRPEGDHIAGSAITLSASNSIYVQSPEIHSTLNQIMLNAFIIDFASLFTMINPLGVVPIYIALTSQYSAGESRAIALKAGLVSFIVLATFALAGKFIFDFFGISVDALKVVGGVLFFAMGYEMMRGRSVPKKLDSESPSEYGDEIAVTPIAIPMITGPGAITMVLIMMQNADAITVKLQVLTSILLVIALTVLILIGGRLIMSALGPSGSKVLMRLMGLIVMMIAVEFFFAGVTPYIVSIGSAIT